MKYNVWFLTQHGRPSMGPSQVVASGIVEAQRVAQLTLAELQDAGVLTGWTIQTVTEIQP